jgi:hypothetical protein
MDVLTGVASFVRVDDEQDCKVQLLEHLGAKRRKHTRKLHAFGLLGNSAASTLTLHSTCHSWQHHCFISSREGPRKYRNRCRAIPPCDLKFFHPRLNAL